MYSFLFIIPNCVMEVNIMQRKKLWSLTALHLYSFKAKQRKGKLVLSASIPHSLILLRLDRLKSDLGFERYLD